MELTREQFARALYQGLGRPILFARTHHATPFADLILDACLYNPIHDRQTGVDRAPYLVELMAATGNAAFFRARILAALADPTEEMDEELLFGLALHFAEGGDTAARRAMVTRFLDNLSSGEPTGADQLVALDGDAGLRWVAEQIGAALARGITFDESWPPWRLLDDLDKAFADDPAVLNDPRIVAFREAVRGDSDWQAERVSGRERRRQLREEVATLSYPELRRAVESRQHSLIVVRRWAEQASEAMLRQAADDLLAIADPGLLWRLLAIFDVRDFPDGHAPLLPLLDHPEPLVARRAAHALARFRHPELRARAERLLAAADRLEPGLILLVGNHEPGDYALIADLVRRHADDDDALHAIAWWAHELFTRAPSPEAVELLLELYERGPCASCRKYVVEHLLALDALPAELAEECRFDANEDVRALVVGAAAEADD